MRFFFVRGAAPQPQDNHNCIGQQKSRASAKGVSAFLFSAAGAVQADLEKFLIFFAFSPGAV